MPSKLGFLGWHGTWTSCAARMSDGGTIPFWDSQTAAALGLDPAWSMVSTREGRLATELLGELPAFLDAPMDEVLDLRKRMDRPLSRFRGVLARAANELAPASDAEFAEALQALRRGEVEPAIADIEEMLDELQCLCRPSRALQAIASQSERARR